MGLLRGSLWLFLGDFILTEVSMASTWHSLKYFHFATLDTGQDLPSFTALGYLDDQLFATYSSKTKEYKPRLPWAEKNLSLEYWDGQSGIGRGNENLYRVDLVILRNRYNQTGGFHTLQYMGGYEVSSDGQKNGYSQFAYDGRDFISFDVETLTWVAASPEAQVSKQKLAADETSTQSRRYYLEEVCVGWLQKLLDCAGEKNLRREMPVVTLTRKTWRTSLSEDLETVICRVDGFYPKDIEVVWTRDGEVWEEETFRGLVTPNSDGTYHTWISIIINSKERSRFRCRVDHASLAKFIESAMDEPASTFYLKHIVAVVGFILLVSLLMGILKYQRKIQDGYRAAPGIFHGKSWSEHPVQRP